jgi:hypothetical protein
MAQTIEHRSTADHEIVHPALLYAGPSGIEEL